MNKESQLSQDARKGDEASKAGISKSWMTVRKKVAVITGEGNRKFGSFDNLGEDETLKDATQQEALKVLNMLQNSEFFQTLPEKSRKRLLLEAEEKKEGKVLALDELMKKEKAEEFNEAEANVEDQKQRDKEDEINRLGYLWRKRSKRLNWSLLGLFHFTLLVNFAICIFESYRIVIEHAKFDKLYLDEEFNCLGIINSGDTVNHAVNIIHAFMCVAGLYADRTDTANILWALVFAQLFHAGNDTFQLFYNTRLPHEHQRHLVGTAISVVLFAVLQVLGTLVVIQRYYDMTGIVVKRTHRFTSAVYGGRLLNEQIIYQNEPDFLQKKYTMRQATAMQIYSIVQKINHYKKREVEPDRQEIDTDIKAGIAALKDVQSLEGPDMLKQLRRRHLKRLKEMTTNDIDDKVNQKKLLKEGTAV